MKYEDKVIKTKLDHLTLNSKLNCEVARELWTMIFSLFSVKWVIPRRLIKLLDCWRDQLESNLVLAAWRMSPLCVMWSIWREQNARCFKIMRGR